MKKLTTMVVALCLTLTFAGPTYAQDSGSTLVTGPQSTPTNTISIRCESAGYAEERCELGVPIQNAVLTQRLSKASCDNQYWFSGSVLVVTNGCRARFNVTLAFPVDVQSERCESWNWMPADCPISTPAPIRAVFVQERFSGSACRTGIDFWWDGDSINVQNGCRAQFGVINYW